MTKSLIVALMLLSLPAAGSALPRLNLERAITVSGLSSGAFFAIQFHLAHSKEVSGVGAVAGGIFGCAEGDPKRSFHPCMSEPGEADVEKYVNLAKSMAEANAIDSLSNLSDDKIFLFQSRNDRVVHFASVEKIMNFYVHFLPRNSIRLFVHERAAHGFPVLTGGRVCGESGSPYLQNCGVDGAGEILFSLLGKLMPPTTVVGRSLSSFSQAEFNSEKAFLHEEGYIYVPSSCSAGLKCRLHIVFHGCRQNQDFVGDSFRSGVGFNGWAEANRLVILYPSVKASSENPFACWDWFGYSGAQYLGKEGPQMLAIQRMIDALRLHTR